MSTYDPLDIVVPTRFFMQTKINRPFDMSAKFVYNYFTPDEAAEEDLFLGDDGGRFISYMNKDLQGNPYDIDSDGKKIVFVNGKQTTGDVLRRISPRFVEVTWNHNVEVPADTIGNETTLLKLNENGDILKEEDISSFYDSSLRLFDPTIRERLFKKIDILRHMKYIDGPLTNEPEFPSDPSDTAMFVKKVQDEMSFPSLTHPVQAFNSLWDYNQPSDSKKVNDLGEDVPSEQYEKAASMMFEFEFDRRLLPAAAASNTIHGRTAMRKLRRYVDLDAVNRAELPEEPHPAAGPSTANLEVGEPPQNLKLETPIIPCETIGSPSEEDSQYINQIRRVGYIIERYDEVDGINLDEPSRVFYSQSPINTNFIDEEVRYGKKYYYTVRTVYRRIFTAEAHTPDGESLGKQILRHYIASKPSPAAYVETKEEIPPNAPDGVFYKFDYDNKHGLIITWQYPTGLQRDTKYFHVFRRKSILDPFTCIAEIDFDNSQVKIGKPEKVKDSRVIKYDGPRTFYEDFEFDRNSSYIYAIASVDAHGLTSGYSAQTRVSFDNNSNSLVLKSVSRDGAPKQYPNFFIDPQEDETLNIFTLTQDVIATSGKKKVTVYLDTPCEKYREKFLSSKKETHLGLRLPGEDFGPQYKIHMINTDRQKDDSIHVVVTDFRGVQE